MVYGHRSKYDFNADQDGDRTGGAREAGSPIGTALHAEPYRMTPLAFGPTVGVSTGARKNGNASVSTDEGTLAEPPAKNVPERLPVVVPYRSATGERYQPDWAEEEEGVSAGARESTAVPMTVRITASRTAILEIVLCDIGSS